MESLENLYFPEKKVKVFWIALLIIVFVIFYFQLDILLLLGKEPRIHLIINFMLGVSAALIFPFLLNSLVRPKFCICTHFFIWNYGLTIVMWNTVRNVTVKGKTLYLDARIAGVRKNLKVSLSFTVNKEELIHDIEKICEIKGIPFEKRKILK